MWRDEIVDEVRAARRAHAEAYGFDLRRIYEDLKRKEQSGGRHVVSLSPRFLQVRKCWWCAPKRAHHNS